MNKQNSDFSITVYAVISDPLLKATVQYLKHSIFFHTEILFMLNLGKIPL